MAGLEQVADTFSSLRTISRFFCHYFRILPETRITMAVVNILVNHRQFGCGSDGSMRKTEQVNRAAIVGEVTLRAEPRTAVLEFQ